MEERQRVVLGIDAAWTLTQPSGVAVAADMGDGWHIVAAEPSYEQFIARADDRDCSSDRPTGSMPLATELLAAAARLAGASVDLVAIDMPLARSPITARRDADNAVSRAYGGRKCGTHTPSAKRPGKISDDLRAGFDMVGYPLRTGLAESPGLIEVYPHPALVELMGATERLPYKVGKVRAYWPNLSLLERRCSLLEQWRLIALALEERIAGTVTAMPKVHSASPGIDMKACEDVLDAIVCAWVGAVALDGQAAAFGSGDAAIWIQHHINEAPPAGEQRGLYGSRTD